MNTSCYIDDKEYIAMNNTIDAYKQNFNKISNTSFTSLNKIKYKGIFNPKRNIEDAKAVLEFKQSQIFKDFFKKYDGEAEFNLVRNPNKDEYWASLNIQYNDTTPKKNVFKRIKTNIQNLFRFNSKDNKSIYITTNKEIAHSNASFALAYKIKQENLENLEKQVEQHKLKEKELKEINLLIDKIKL